MKRKDKDKKIHENIIGKIIYGFLLFMPLLAIMVTCAYAIFNKNAYQSYYGDTINQKELIQIDDITTYSGNIIYDNDTTITYSFTNGTNYFNVDNFKSEIVNLNNDLVKKIQMYSAVYQTDYNMWLSLRDNNNNIIQNINLALNSIYFTCDIIDYSKSGNNTILGNFANYFYETKYNDNSFVSEVFYYSIDRVQESPLFNWAKNSAIYTGMNATCNALDITTPFIPLLMTYWLIISVIYILYDIILVILHIFHKKIHQLEDSF